MVGVHFQSFTIPTERLTMKIGRTSAGVCLLGMALSAVLAVSPALAYETKHIGGSVSGCGGYSAPYAGAYATGAMIHKAPGGKTHRYTNLGWATRGYYGPGGSWSVDANSPSGYIETTRSGGYCRNP